MNQIKDWFMAALNRTSVASSGLGLDLCSDIMHNVYVLYSKADSKFYIGYTSDIKRRIKEHTDGGVHTTARYKNPALIYYESFISKEDTIRRERYFKTTKGKKALKIILRESLKSMQ